MKSVKSWLMMGVFLILAFSLLIVMGTVANVDGNSLNCENKATESTLGSNEASSREGIISIADGSVK